MMNKAKGTGAAKKGVKPAKKMAMGGATMERKPMPNGMMRKPKPMPNGMRRNAPVQGGKGGMGGANTVPQNLSSGMNALRSVGGAAVGPENTNKPAMKNGGKVGYAKGGAAKMPKSMGVAVKDSQKAPAKSKMRGGGAATRGTSFGKNG